MAKTVIEFRLAFNNDPSVCSAPAKRRKLSIISSNTLPKSILPIKSLAKPDTTGNTKPVTIRNTEKTIEIIIIPMVSGNFKTLVLMYAKTAVITTSMVMMTKMLMKKLLIVFAFYSKHFEQYTHYFPIQNLLKM